MAILQTLLMAGMLLCCLHQSRGFDHRFRDELTMTFPKLRPADLCEPGTSSDDGCNVCICSSKGMWMCTLRRCERPLPISSLPWSPSKDVPIVDNIPGAPSLVREKRSPIAIGSTTLLVRDADKCRTQGDVGTNFQDGCRACRCMAPNLAGCSTALCGAEETTVAPTEEATHEPDSTTTPAPTEEATTTMAPIPVERVTPVPASVFCKTRRDFGMRYFDGCNRCRCIGIGRAGCGRRACPVVRRVTPTPASEVCATEEDTGKRYFDGCNLCRCFSVGNAACTYRACPVIQPTKKPPTNRRPRTRTASEVCKTTGDMGKRFYDGCNWCSCARVGGAACTRRGCRRFPPRQTTPAPVTAVTSEARPQRVQPTPASQVCKSDNDIGKSYFNGCNWCHCMGVGRAGCTRRMCPFVKQQTTTTAAPTPGPGWFCTSSTDIGRQHYDGCNTCMCSRGLRKICTMRHCLPVVKQ